MKCPNCGHGENRVVWARERDGRTVRARDCLDCGKRFQTAEAPIEEMERAKDITEAFEMMRRAVGE